ncbi:MAG: VWA domain-containing protein [Myxococcales bacterium]|nr:VWA domain-containing protein [Myxococcales bacterium]
MTLPTGLAAMQSPIPVLVLWFCFAALSPLAGGALAFAATVESGSDAATVVIDIVSPAPGETVRNRVHLAAIRGSARSGAEDPLDFDVMIAIDVSKSTRFPSGIDVDQNGEIGFNPHEELIAPGSYPDEVVCSDPADSILSAEIQAARMLVDSLSPGRSRVGVLTFSGDVDLETGERNAPDQKDATLRILLTDDFASVIRVLGEIHAEGPHGATNFAAAIHLAVVELVGLSGSRSVARPGARHLLQFLTDGVPTFPFGRGDVADPEDTEVAISAARLARKAGLTLNSFAWGRHALASPVATTEMARLTGGAYTPVRNPGEILAFLRGVSFANIDDVVITNLTTHDISYDVHLSPDGSFSGFVPVDPGSNKVQVTVLASDGGESTIAFDVNFEKSGLTENELMVELRRVRKRNKEMMLLLERKRIRAFRERQKGVITIEGE